MGRLPQREVVVHMPLDFKVIDTPKLRVSDNRSHIGRELLLLGHIIVQRGRRLGQRQAVSIRWFIECADGSERD